MKAGSPMMMNKKFNIIAAYFVYPLGFLVVGVILWLIVGEPIYNIIDAKICMQITKSAPDTYNSIEPFVLTIPKDVKDNSVLDSGEHQVPTYGTQFGQILCSNRNLDVPLYLGDDEELLRRGAGMYDKSTLPGYHGTSIIGAHDITYFAPLKDIQLNDEITIITDYGNYLYKVVNINIAKDTDDIAYRAENEEEKIVLYTCYPFGDIEEDREYRYFVICNRITTLTK